MSVKNLLRKHLFLRQHPDAALRYLPLVELLKNVNLQDSKILEVGSGSYGITPYLKKEVIGLDVAFDEPEFSLLRRISGTAVNLPFKDSQFDVVILSDVLEHMPKAKRKKALYESVRVAKRMVIISGPIGQKSLEQDKKLAAYSEKILGDKHKFFDEHLRFGLPAIDEIDKYLNENPKVKEVKVIGEYLNLKVREILMKFFITKNKPLYYFYLKGLMLFIPILRYLNMRPCYRTLIIARL